MMVLLLAQVHGIWPMWGGEPSHRSFQTMRGAMTTAPVIKWYFFVGTSGPFEWQFASVRDVDGDGIAEVVMGSWNDTLYCLNGITGALEWKFGTGNLIQSSPAAGDVDGDGKIEIVFGSYDHNVYCLRGTDGSQKWAYTTGDAVMSSPALADVDGDGKTEVVIGSLDDRLYCLRGTDGGKKWEFLTGANVSSSPAVADCDGDGKHEIIFGSFDGKVYCLSGQTGAQKWVYSTSGEVRSSPAVADLDADGQMEVIIGSHDGYLHCIRGSNGTQKWTFWTANAVSGSPAIADVDGNGKLDIVIGSQDLYVYCIDHTGTERWNRYCSGQVHTPGALVDIDNDGKLEFLVPNYTKDTLVCLNAENGTTLWRRRLFVTNPDGDVHSPVPADIDGDNCVEVLVGTYNLGMIYALDDPSNTQGCSPIGFQEESGGFEMKPIPNGIQLFLPKSAWVSLVLYDAEGRPVQRLYEGVLSAGDHTFILRLRSIGIYLAVLRCNGGTKTIKFIVK